MNPNNNRLRLFNPDATDDLWCALEPAIDDTPVGEQVADAPASTETALPPPITTALPLDGLRPSAELELVLNAWHAATERLQKTHEVLCGEVRRLTAELEIKNRELARKNRLADLGQMASHVAHEVRNGLSPITLYLSWLRRRLHDDMDGLRILDKLQAGCLEVQTTVSDMLSFAADREPNWRRFSLPELVEELNGTLAPQYAAHRIEVRVDVPPLWIWADRDLLRRALINLLLNAVDVLPQGGGIWITSCDRPDGIEIEVADNGPGLTESATHQLFEPFYTTKSEGSGLGLAIVQRVVEAHGGEAFAKNCPEGGAAFTLRIPHRAMEAAA